VTCIPKTDEKTDNQEAEAIHVIEVLPSFTGSADEQCGQSIHSWNFEGRVDMNFERILAGSFEKIEFEPGELAFLAATSKVEQPIRDRLSWRLQQTLKDYDVVREWRRADIAILKDESPVAVIELKAMYTFDAASNYLMEVVDAIWKDEQKALKLVGPEVPIFTVLLAAHPKPINPALMKPFIKYRDGIIKSLRTETCEEVSAAADRIVTDSFLYKAPRNLAFRHIVHGNGESFNVPFDVQVWCFRFAP
jgi:hypothetical protein